MPFYFIVFFIALFSPSNSYADFCPKKIVGVSGAQLSNSIGSIVQKIYKELDCSTSFEFLPGRRSIHAFNRKDYDGEVARLKLVEARYVRSFVRSEDPMFSSVLGVWKNPLRKDKKGTLGGLIGIIWQENFSKSDQNMKYDIHLFNNYSLLFNAYNKGRIVGFLADEASIVAYQELLKIDPLPILERNIERVDFYHYLGGEYSEFMNEYSDHIKKNDYFKKYDSKH